jgi:PAS domain S-box-containing protein
MESPRSREAPAGAYGALLEAVPVAAILLDLPGLDLVAGNGEAAAILAATPEALAGPWQEALAPPHGLALRDRLAAVTSRTAPEVFDAVLTLPDRPPRDLLVRARQVEIDGRLLLSAGFIDITRRHRAETALATAHARLEVALRGADLGTWQWEARTGRIEVSERWASMLGRARPPSGLSLTEWEALMHPEDLPAMRAALAAHLAEPASAYEAEFRLRHGEGHWVWVLARGRTTEWSARGRSVGMTGTHLDITAAKQAEAARAESRREARRRLADLEMLYRTAPLGLGQMDRDFRFIRINEALAEMNGLPVEAHLGCSAWELLPGMRAAAEPLLRQVLETGEVITGIELSGETPKAPGVQRNWLEQFYPVHDPETQAVVGIGIVCEEITERKQAEAARELLLRELDHRVKNLFAVIGGLVSFTARTAPTPAAMRDVLLGRIGALASGHDLVRPALAGSAVAGAAGPSLAQLLETLLEPFRAGPGQVERLFLAGPAVPLGQTGAPQLALAMHELATNAAKYGALQSSGGRVSVEWTVLPAAQPDAGGTCLLLRWQEDGALVREAPAASGFGLRLVRQSCAQLGGTVSLDWRATGLAAELLLPLDRLAR